MSHYRRMETEFTSRAMLREALKAAEVPFEEAQPGEELELQGWGQQTRHATFAVRASRESGAICRYADMGWQWDPETKRFVELLDSMETYRTEATRDRIRREYAVATTIAQARTRGLTVKREDQANGAIRLRVVGQVQASGLVTGL
jgi:hypothetical protein